MLNIHRYILIHEGGQAGHMAHPIDYTDFTKNDLIELIENLFSGKIEHIKEKLDGMNIMATMNDKGDVVFIRNNSNLNSESGGMSIEDMANKWSNKEHQKQIFTQAGNIITKIFKRLGKDFFNLKNNIRKVINCECIIHGKTNVLLYANDMVAFHGYKLYQKQENGKYKEIDDVEGHVEEIYDVAKDIDDAAKPRKDLIIRSIEDANKLANKFIKDINDLFDSVNLSKNATIEQWKIERFKELKPEYIHIDENFYKLFNRWFNNDKSFKASDIKKIWPEHYNELKDDKYAKKYIQEVIKPLDNLFLNIGNSFIELLDGFTNDEQKDSVINDLSIQLQDTINAINKSNLDAEKEKVEYQLQRLEKLGNKINHTEGIVFTYKGRRMKLTGSFAAINAIIGSNFVVKK